MIDFKAEDVSAPHEEGCACSACSNSDGHDHTNGELHVHGSIDPTYADPSLRGPESFVTSGGRWTDGGGFTSSLGGSGGTVSWSLGGAGLTDTTGQFFSGSTVAMSTFLTFDFAATLQRAFDAWSAHADIKFVQVDDEGGNIGAEGSPTIRVVGGFIDGQDGANTLARAFFPTSHPAGGDIVFDSGNTSFYASEHNFFLTALHEIGHAIGLGHEDTANAIAIMNPVINTSLDGLQADDIAGAITVYGAATAPDLIAGNLLISNGELTVGETVNVTFDITNDGNGEAANSTAGVYISTDATITTGDTLVSSVVSTTSGAAGAVGSQALTLNIPDLDPGTYYLGVIADINNDEDGESDEANNVSNVVEITIAAADPYPDLVVVEDDGDIITTTFDDVGQRETLTFEDGSNSRSWADYVNTYSPTGAVNSRVTTYDDGRILTTNFVNGVRSEQTMADIADLFAWSDYVETFDANGTLANREQTFDNGRIISTDFVNGVQADQAITISDTADNFIWSSYTSTLNASGTLTNRELTYDDGRVLVIDFADGVRAEQTMTDIPDLFAWTSYTENFDQNGDLTRREQTYDDGRILSSDFVDGVRTQQMVTVNDTSNSFIWSSSTNTLNASGTLVNREQIYDDGRVLSTDFVNGVRSEQTMTDVTDLFSWASYTEKFDGTGGLINREQTYDDGRFLSTDFVNGVRSEQTMTDVADVYSWLSYTETFDSNGGLTHREQTFDDGRIISTNFVDGVRSEQTVTDVNDLYSWLTYIDAFDNVGEITTREITDDNGTSTTQYFPDDLNFV